MVSSPEPTLDRKIHERIVQIIHDTCLGFERHPSTYANMDEEALRDVILTTLQPHLPGSATGETFNKSGKTDILLRHQNHNIFVAECKIWRGKKSFVNGIDQLLGYLTVRDSKVALIFFVRNKAFSSVLKEAQAELNAHKCFVSLKHESQDGAYSEAIFHLPDDEDRKVQMTTLFCHLGEAEHSQGRR